MLSQLKIKDFAIIDDLTIEFNEHMTVLTGETGSGKSIIIDAINLLLGERASNDMVRHDKEKALIEGVIFYNNPKIDELLEEFGVSIEDQTIVIAREVARNGRNVCRLNGSLVTVNQLKQLGAFLIDVHVQHDTTRLVNTNNYLYLLDSFSDEDFNLHLKEYQENFHTYNDLLKKYHHIIKENKSNQEKLDFYKFQQEEFKQSKMSLEEYNDLNQKRNLYVNYDKIYENLNKSYNNIVEKKILENLYDSANSLSKISHVNTKYQEMSEQLFNIYYLIDEESKKLFEEINSLDYDPNELNRIDTRLSIYSTFKRKYKLEIEELMDYKNKLEEKINQIDQHDLIIQELDEALKISYKKTLDLALSLRTYRQKKAKDIETSLVSHLADLKLMNTNFHILFNTPNLEENYLNGSLFNENGVDEVDFYVSFNKGEPTKPLSKVASGGELSRFMLALKTILTEYQNLSTIIFDEIDTGVSGITAAAIAQKIKSISKKTQVLCITHLAQVASVATHHLYISKKEVNDRTLTQVNYLDDEDRIIEIAKMISGENIDGVTIQNARNLLKKT